MGRGHQPGGLRIVQDHNVIAAHQVGELASTGAQAALIKSALSRPQPAPVSLGSMQMVVQPFGDGKERRVADDHRPPRVDPAPTGVAEQRSQQLDDATAARGGVHIPDHPALQRLCRAIDQLKQSRVLARRDHRLKTARVHRCDRNVLERSHPAHLTTAGARPQPERYGSQTRADPDGGSRAPT
jgi:hypothetical protein